MTFKIKGPSLKMGPIDILNIKLSNNYFAWIANLGVVPLFLLAAFLFVPALFFLAALLFFVTLVLETIVKLLSIIKSNNLNYFKVSFLPIIVLSVKGFMIAQCVESSNSFAQTSIERKTQRTTMVLAKGEVVEIDSSNLLNFQVSNKEVIKYKLTENDQKISVKGQMLGHSGIIINTKKIIKKIDVFVVNKSLDASITGIMISLSEIVPEVKISNNSVTLFGTIYNIKDYLILSTIVKENSKIIKNKVTLSDELKNELKAKVLSQLLKYNIEYVICKVEDFYPECLYDKKFAITAKIQDASNEKYGTVFTEIDNAEKRNLKLKIKFVQLEKLDGMEFNLGLDRLDSTLSDIINNPIVNVIGKNQFILKQNNIDMSTLAEPETLLSLNEESSIELGNETPYSVTDKNQNTHTTWHFSGLRVRFTVSKYLDRFEINYNSELTRENSENGTSTTGTKSKSKVYLEKNTPLKLFEINMKTVAKNTTALPLLSQLPLLGEIFKSKSSTDNYKKIIAIAEVKYE